MLAQQTDSITSAELDILRVHERAKDLELAWRLCQLLRSNAIVFVNQLAMLAGGVGETSRIDALENAIRKAQLHGHSLRGSVIASDAFFPFPDSIELIASNGGAVVLSPAGSKNDGEVQKKADELGVELIFMPARHFRH